MTRHDLTRERSRHQPTGASTLGSLPFSVPYLPFQRCHRTTTRENAFVGHKLAPETPLSPGTSWLGFNPGNGG